MENPFTAVQNANPYRRRKTPEEIAAERAPQQGMGRQDIADMEIYRANNARQAQERSYAQQSSEAEKAGNRALRLAVTQQTGEMPTPAAPSRPDPVEAMRAGKGRNLEWRAKEEARIATTGARPRAAYQGSASDPYLTSYKETATSPVRATAPMMRQGEMQAQRSKLADVRKSNIVGYDYYKSMVGALRTPVESMNARDGTATYQTPEESLQGVRLDAAGGGVNRDPAVFPDQQIIRNREQLGGGLPARRDQQDRTSALAQDTSAGILSPDHQLALDNRLAGAGYPVEQPQVPAQDPSIAQYQDLPQTPDWRSLQWQNRPFDPSTIPATDFHNAQGATPMAPGGTIPPRKGSWWDQTGFGSAAQPGQPQSQQPPITIPGLNPDGQTGFGAATPQAAQPTPDRATQPGGFDLAEYRGIHAQRAREAQNAVEQFRRENPAPAAQRTARRGTPADMRELQYDSDKQKMELERLGAGRAMQGGGEAIMGRIKAAVDRIPTDSPDSILSGIENALSNVQTEQDAIDAQTLLINTPAYKMGDSDPALKAYIETLIYNARARAVGMPLRPLPPRPQAPAPNSIPADDKWINSSLPGGGIAL
jgi:hypothetical protein